MELMSKRSSRKIAKVKNPMKNTEIFEDLARHYAQQNPPQENGGQQNPQDDGGNDPEQVNPAVDTDALQQGQVIYDLSGKEYTVLEPTPDGKKNIMPSDQIGQQVPQGIKQVGDDELNSSFTTSPQASRKHAQEDLSVIDSATWNIKSAIRDLQPLANRESSELGGNFSSAYIDPLEEMAGFLSLEKKVSEREARKAQEEPYGGPCPVCGSSFVLSCRCLQRQCPGVGKKGHGRTCKKGHQISFDGKLAVDVSGKEVKTSKIAKIAQEEPTLNWADFDDILDAMKFAISNKDAKSLMEAAEDMVDLILMNVSMPEGTDVSQVVPKVSEVLPAFRTGGNDRREQETGRYSYGKSQKLCTCGHPLGAHDLGYVCQHQDWDVKDESFCECEKFTPTNESISDEEWATRYGRGLGDYSWGTEKESNILPAFRTAQIKEKVDQADMMQGFESGNTFCARCGQKLNKNNVMWLDMNTNTGEYSDYLWPEEESQGVFPFGKDCAKDVLAKGGQVDFIMHEASILKPFRRAQMGDINSFHEPQTFSGGKDDESGLVIGEGGFGDCMTRLKEMVNKGYEVVDIILTLGEEFPRELANKVLAEAREKGVL